MQVKKSWILLLSVFLLEFLLFRAYALREVVNYYPAGFDQASYLTLIYQNYAAIKQQGIITGLHNFATLPTGFLFPVQAVLFLLLTGPARFHLLLLNFFYFIALQLCVFRTACSLRKQNYMGIIILGLLLCAYTPFISAGGIMDFRMDFMAFCLYGIFVTGVIKSRVFLDKKGTWIVILLALWLILLRFITSVYLGLIFVALFTGLLFLYRQNINNPIKLHETKTRLINVFFTCLIIGVFVILYYFCYKTAIDNYYVLGHLTGNEKYIRARAAGVTTFLDNLFYYPSSVLFDHIGNLSLIASGYLLLLSLCVRYQFNISGENAKKENNFLFPFKEGVIFLVFTIFIPLVILTLDIAKSSIVGGILVMPWIWLIVWIFNYILPDNISVNNKTTNKILFVSAILVLLLGLITQIHNYIWRGSVKRHKGLANITKMYDDIGNYAQTKHLVKVRLSVDQISDYLTFGGIATLYYERHAKWLRIEINPLGASIFKIDKAQALQSLKNSDVVILNRDEYVHYSPYPFDQSVKVLHPLLRQYAERHFKRLGDYNYSGMTFQVYVRG